MTHVVGLLWLSGAAIAFALQHSKLSGEHIDDSTSVDTMPFRAPSEVASLFNSQKCQHAIRESRPAAWYSQSPSGQMFIGQTAVSPAERTIYVRNQKVASTYFVQSAGPIFNSSSTQSYGIERRYRGREVGKSVKYTGAGIECLREVGANKGITSAAKQAAARKCFDLVPDDDAHALTGQDWFVWTVVADPLKTAISGYLEVTRRAPETMAATRGMKCTDRASSTARAIAFFEGLEAYPECNECMHSWPQAVRIGVEAPGGRRDLFDAIGHLERVNEDLVQMQVQALSTVRSLRYTEGTLPEIPQEKASQIAAGQGSTSELDCADIDLDDPILMRKFCDIYRVDYECFDYEKPAACG